MKNGILSSKRMPADAVVPIDEHIEGVNSRVVQSFGNEKVQRSALSNVPNPFVYRGKLWTCGEVLKIMIFGPILLPLRIIAGILCALISFFFLGLSISCGFDPNVPMTGWRRRMQYPAAYSLRIYMFILGMYYVETTGKPCSISEAKTVVCAPHSTLLDTFYLIYAYSVPSAISKLENLSYPLFGVMFRAMQVVTVDRGSKTNRQMAFDTLKLRANSETARHLLIFPEGTCTNREALISFKLGGFAGGKPIQPVAIEWPWCTGFDMTWSAAGWPSRFSLGLHLLCQPIVRCRVHFLPVYSPSAEEQVNLRLFADNVRQVIADKLNLPVTKHSIEDMFLAKEANRLKLNVGVQIPFEMEELTNLFNIDLGDAKKLLRRYAAEFKSKPKIDVESFARVLGVPCSDAVRDLFQILKENEGDNEVDFKHLLIGICHLSRVLNSTTDLEQSIELVWQAIAGEDAIQVTDVVDKMSTVFPGLTKKMARKLFQTSGTVDKETYKKVMRENAEIMFVAVNSLSKTDNGKPKRRLSVLSKEEDV